MSVRAQDRSGEIAHLSAKAPALLEAVARGGSGSNPRRVMKTSGGSSLARATRCSSGCAEAIELRLTVQCELQPPLQRVRSSRRAELGSPSEKLAARGVCTRPWTYSKGCRVENELREELQRKVRRSGNDQKARRRRRPPPPPPRQARRRTGMLDEPHRLPERHLGLEDAVELVLDPLGAALASLGRPGRDGRRVVVRDERARLGGDDVGVVGDRDERDGARRAREREAERAASARKESATWSRAARR